MRGRARRPALVAVALMLAAIPASGARAAGESASPAKIAALSGTWMLTGAGRACRLQLAPPPAGRERPLLGAPPACRASMPVLRGAAGWTLTRDGALHLTNGAGEAVLALRPEAGGAFRGSAEAGGDYALTPVERRLGAAGERAAAITAALGLADAEPKRGAEASPRPSRAQGARAGETGGVYLAAREPGRPVCWIALAPAQAGQAGLREARLEPACTDEGLRVFDPVAWRLEEDRLFVVARAGQAIGFAPEPNGAWRKEPSEGRPLLLTRP